MESPARELLRAVDEVVYTADPNAEAAATADGLGTVTLTRSGSTVVATVELDHELAFRRALGITSDQLDQAASTQALGFQVIRQDDTHVWLLCRTAVLGEMAARVEEGV